MKFYMFRTVRLSIIGSLFTVHSEMVYVIQVCRQLSSRMELRSILVVLESFLHTCMIYTISECTVNKLLMMARRNVRLVHLVGFITKKFVTVHGHMNAKAPLLYVEIKCQTRCNRGFYCRSYCLLNMFRASLCPSSGAQEYYTVVAACGTSCCGFQVVGLVWS